jgi:hypothetical protein
MWPIPGPLAQAVVRVCLSAPKRSKKLSSKKSTFFACSAESVCHLWLGYPQKPFAVFIDSVDETAVLLNMIQ